MEVDKEREVVRDKTDGEERRDGVVDLLQMTEAPQVTVETKTTKTSFQFAPEI